MEQNAVFAHRDGDR